MNQYLINKLVLYDIIKKNEVEEYTYAILLIELKIFHCTIFLISGLLFNEMIEYITFLLTYSLTRQYLGGFHARKSRDCFLLSMLFSFGLHAIIQIVNLKILLSFILILFLSFLIVVVNKNHKKKLLLCLLFINFSCIFFLYLNCNTLLLSIVYGLSLTLFLKCIVLKIKIY